LGKMVPYLIYVIRLELCHAAGLLRLRCHRDGDHALLFRVVRATGPPSLLPHCVGWVGVVHLRDQPPFVASGTLHGLGSKKAEAPSTTHIIPGVNF
jgi:hypothetical protein